MTDTTREQDNAAEYVAAFWGRCAVEPSHLHDITGNVVITGILGDDIEMSRWSVCPNGKVANVAWRDDCLEAYLKENPQERFPMMVPRDVQTGGLKAAS